MVCRSAQDWKLLNCGRFSIDGLVKAGIFDNNADETTEVSIYRTVYGESASTNHAAFLGEIGLQCKYQVTDRLLLKAGYEALWLQGVALAPGQIPQTLSHVTPVTDVYVQALGIDSGSGVFYHGATAGLEYLVLALSIRTAAIRWDRAGWPSARDNSRRTCRPRPRRPAPRRWPRAKS